MKRFVMLIAVVLPCFIFTACDKDNSYADITQQENHEDSQNTDGVSETGGVTQLHITTANIVCYLNITGEKPKIHRYGVIYSTKSGVNIENCLGMKDAVDCKDNAYNVLLTGLEEGTTYYYRSYVNIDGRYMCGAEKSFTTTKLKLTAERPAFDMRTVNLRVASNLQKSDLACDSLKLLIIWGKSADIDIDNAEGYSGCFLINDYTGYGFGTKKEFVGYSAIYYFRGAVRTGNKYTYTEAIPFITRDKPETYAGHPIDLGLSVKWADMNIGALEPEDSGDFFAWGETTPKEYYDWASYKYCKGSSNSLLKYCTDSSFGYNSFTDNRIKLAPEDDAATTNWGLEWRMPTNEELMELCNKCTWKYEDTYSFEKNKEIEGYTVTGPNNNSIFIPITGIPDGAIVRKDGVNKCTELWSSSLISDSPQYAMVLEILDGSYSWRIRQGKSSRKAGRPIRPVCK